MNIHPLIVHFPIAFLTLYSFMEVVRLRAWTTQPFWQPMKILCVVIGVIGAFLSLSTGESAERLFRGTDLMRIVEVHSAVATVTTWIYAIAAIGYVIVWVEQRGFAVKLPSALRGIWQLLLKIARMITQTVLAPLIAIAGFLGLALTGGLGGLLVHGANADPFTQLLQNVLFP